MRIRRPVVLALLLGALAGGVTLVLVFRGPGRPLDRAALERAEALWKRNGPRSYRLEVTLSGARAAVHRVVVRDGRVIEATTDGRATPPRIRDVWTVDGMFRTLREELDIRERPQTTYGVGDASQVELLAEFEAGFGYPRRFVRHVNGEQLGIEWEVTAFDVR